jgi:ergothioneine biosynthesis protein EgtB
MGQCLVTQLEFWQFMSSGGYQRPEWWLSLGWEWRKQGAVTAPLYWRQVAGDGLALEDWRQFTLSGELPTEPHAPMRHLSYFEADACARWAGARLPTETEWELPALSGQLHQAHGQCWQWTSSAFSPYPGYKPWAGAVGEYNGKFMCQQLVLRGSSLATPQGHARDSYRNFFRPRRSGSSLA